VVGAAVVGVVGVATVCRRRRSVVAVGAFVVAGDVGDVVGAFGRVVGDAAADVDGNKLGGTGIAVVAPGSVLVSGGAALGLEGSRCAAAIATPPAIAATNAAAVATTITRLRRRCERDGGACHASLGVAPGGGGGGGAAPGQSAGDGFGT
jgi:hypothetical protein